MNRIRYALALLLIASIARADDRLPPGALYRIGAYRMYVPRECTCFAVSPSGKTIVAAGPGSLNNGEIRSWDLMTGQFRSIAADVNYAVAKERRFLAISRDGKQIACGCMGGTIRRWETETGKELKPIEMPLAKWPCVALSFSPDGNRLLAGYATTNITMVIN
jgi:WD40 repeat protein